MKKVSIYRPSTVDEAIQILSQHGASASGEQRSGLLASGRVEAPVAQHRKICPRRPSRK